MSSRPQPLDYELPARRLRRTRVVAFWSIYSICVMVGLVVLEGMLADFLFGRPGDLSVWFLTLVSTVVLTAIVAALFRFRLRYLPPSQSLTLAALLGLTAFLPAYAVIYIFF